MLAPQRPPRPRLLLHPLRHGEHGHRRQRQAVAGGYVRSPVQPTVRSPFFPCHRLQVDAAVGNRRQAPQAFILIQRMRTLGEHCLFSDVLF